MDNKIVEKIQKLLSLATSPNEHESRLATEKANDLLIKHNLKLQDVANFKQSKYIEADISKTGRMESEAKWVLSILKQHFFVDPVISRSRMAGITRVYLIGEETNVEVAKYVYSFLVDKFYALWREYKFINSADTNQKQSYYAGLHTGLCEQLSERLKKVQNETGLVVIRDPKLNELTKDFKKRRFRAETTDQAALERGYQDGKKIKIQKGLSSDSTETGKYLE